MVKKPLKPDDLYQLLEHIQNNEQKIPVTVQCRRDASCHGKSEEGGTTLMLENSLRFCEQNLVITRVILFTLLILCLLLVITLYRRLRVVFKSS